MATIGYARVSTDGKAYRLKLRHSTVQAVAGSTVRSNRVPTLTGHN